MSLFRRLNSIHGRAASWLIIGGIAGLAALLSIVAAWRSIAAPPDVPSKLSADAGKDSSRNGRIEKAQQALSGKRYKEAAKLFLQFLSDDPNNDRALLGLAEARRGLGQNDEAAQIYQRLLALFPNDFSIRLTTADFLLQAGKPSEAAEAFARLAREYSKNMDVLKGAARSHAAAGRAKSARKYFETALEQGDDPVLRREFAEFALKAEYYKQAVEQFEALSAASPKDTELKYRLAHAYALNGQPDKVDDLVRKLLPKDLQDVEAMKRLAETEALAGRTDRAIDKYELITRMQPEDAKARARLAELLQRRLRKDPSNDLILQRLAQLSLDVGDYTGASRYTTQRAKRGVALTEDEMAQWVRSLRLSKQTDSALKTAKAAYEAFPKSTAILTEYVEVLLAQKDYESALNPLIMLASRRKDEPRWTVELGRVLLQVGRKDAAYKLLADQRDKTPDDAAVTEVYADAAADVLEHKTAFNAYEKLLKANPKDIGLLQKTARQAFLAGDKKAAETHYSTLAALPNAPLQARMDYARVLSANEKFEDAATQFKGILKEYPDNTKALRGLMDAQVWQGDFVAGAHSADRLVTLLPTDKELRERRAQITLWAGKPERAAEFFAALVQNDEDNYALRRSLADALLNASKWSAAVVEYEHLLRLNPNDAKVKQNLDIARTAAEAAAAAGTVAATETPAKPSQPEMPTKAPSGKLLPEPPTKPVEPKKPEQPKTDEGSTPAALTPDTEPTATETPTTEKVPVVQAPTLLTDLPEVDKPEVATAPPMPGERVTRLVVPEVETPRDRLRTLPAEGSELAPKGVTTLTPPLLVATGDAATPAPLSPEDISALPPISSFESRSGAPSGGMINVTPDRTQALIDRERILTSRTLWLRRAHGPEIAYTHLGSNGDIENTSQDLLAMYIPVANQVSGAILVKSGRYDYDLQPGNVSPDYTAITLRGVLTLDPRLFTWTEVTPYFGDADGLGLGVGLGFDPRPDLQIRLAARGWQVWDETALAVANDGYFHELAGAVSYQISDHAYVSISGHHREFYLGQASIDGLVGSGKYGDGNEVNVQFDYIIWENPDRTVGDTFLDPYVWNEDAITHGVRAYAAARYRDYSMKNATTVPVIDESSEFRIGLTYTHVFSRHLGIVIGGFAGADSKRDLNAGDLYGGAGRIVFVPNERLRLWLGYGMSSEAATGAGGQTGYPDFGLNINF